MKFSTLKSTEDKIDINMDESELPEVVQQPKIKSSFNRKSNPEEDVEEATEEVVVEKQKKKGFFKKSKKSKEPKDDEDAADEVEEEETEEVEKVEKSKKSFFRRKNKDKSVVKENAEDNDEEEEVEDREDEPKKKKKMFSLPKINKGKKEKEEEPMPNDEEQLEEVETEEKPEKKKSFFKLGGKKKDLVEELVAEEEEVENPDTPKDETGESRKKKFFSFKKKTPTKEIEPQTEETPQVGENETEAESKPIDSVDDKITLQSSQDEVRENVEPEQPVILSTSASSSSSVSALPTAVSADMNISLKESIVSADRSTQYEPLPVHDVPLPPSAVKQTAYSLDEESVEDVTPASPKADDKSLEDAALSMDKPLPPRSDAPSDDISSPKAQSIAEAQSEDKLVEDPSGTDTADEQVAEEETPVTTTEETEIGDSSLSKKPSEIDGSDVEIATNKKSTDDTKNTGMFCGCFNP